MGCERRRAGSFYAMLVIGAVTLIGLVAGLQLQMDQQMARARRLKGGAEAALLARQGIESAALALARTGTLPARARSTPEGGELVVVAEGPRPAGSRAYVVFARGRYAGSPVTMIADLRAVGGRAQIGNRELVYVDVDVDAPAVRARLIAARATAFAGLKRRIDGYRSEGAGLSARFAAFFAQAAQGRIPSADRARITSAVATALTTTVP